MNKNFQHIGCDFSNGKSITVIELWYGGRNGGKTYWVRLWAYYQEQDIITKRLLRKLAAEAIINVIIHS